MDISQFRKVETTTRYRSEQHVSRVDVRCKMAGHKIQVSFGRVRFASQAAGTPNVVILVRIQAVGKINDQLTGPSVGLRMAIRKTERAAMAVKRRR